MTMSASRQASSQGAPATPSSGPSRLSSTASLPSSPNPPPGSLAAAFQRSSPQNKTAFPSSAMLPALQSAGPLQSGPTDPPSTVACFPPNSELGLPSGPTVPPSGVSPAPAPAPVSCERVTSSTHPHAWQFLYRLTNTVDRAGNRKCSQEMRLAFAFVFLRRGWGLYRVYFGFISYRVCRPLCLFF